MKKRVVVTGLGTVNPLGNDVATFWEGIKAGRNGVGPITYFDTTDFTSKIGGQLKDFDPGLRMDKKEARKMDPFTQYAAYAAVEAMADANLTSGENVDPLRLGVIIGNGIGGINTLESSYWALFEKGAGRIPPMTIPKLISNEGPGNVAIMHNAQGPCYSIVTACASATDAIGAAAQWIRNGMCDAIITGGTEAAISKMGIGGFCVLHALSTRNDDPQRASRPFDKDRDGFVMGEGAGLLVLEELEHAKARGATIYAELAGYGMTCDANHLTAPHPEGRGAILAMKMALAEAGLAPTDIDYINAHGTSTPVNDPIETAAIKAAFDGHAYKLKVSSTKSMTGHLVGAAGGVEAIVSILAMRDGFYPPTINLDEPDPACDLDYVPNKGVTGTIDAVMSNSLGFGGHNGVVVFTKY